MNNVPTCGLSDAIEMLRSEGFNNANGPRLYHAIRAGHIERPALDGSLRYRFTKKDLKSIRAYLSNVPAPGRRAKVYA